LKFRFPTTKFPPFLSLESVGWSTTQVPILPSVYRGEDSKTIHYILP
jgi:hypothetical protein